MNKPIHTLGVTLLALLGAAGCGDDGAATDPSPAIASSTRNHLIWKRYHAVEQDLSRALELSPDELCTELGQFRCVDEAHLAGLGGHDPFGPGLFEPVGAPLVTTSLALDRVALSACGTRVQRDQQSPVVFTDLELDGSAPASDSDAFTRTIDTLYQRLLGRDPVTAEYETMTALLVDDDDEPVSAARFAHLACFTVATTSEFLFF